MGVAEFQRALVGHKLVALDTMVFIYLLDEHPAYVEIAAALFAMIERGELQGVTSTLTLAEVLTRPAQQANVAALRDYELYLTNFPNLDLAALSVDGARRAATVRAATGLKMPDAIQIATAHVAGADAIISNDKAWRNKINQPALLLLDDFV